MTPFAFVNPCVASCEKEKEKKKRRKMKMKKKKTEKRERVWQRKQRVED